MDAPDDRAREEADFARELAARRRDLEDEFSAKMRELKAQEKRRLDRLRQEQAEWDDERRRQKKELADREHALKGREGRVSSVAHKGSADNQQLAELRAKVADLQERRDALANRQAGLEGKAAKQALRAQARWWRLVAVVVIAIAGGLVWLILSLKQGGGSRVALPLALLALVLGATLWPARTQGRNP